MALSFYRSFILLFLAPAAPLTIHAGGQSLCLSLYHPLSFPRCLYISISLSFSSSLFPSDCLSLSLGSLLESQVGEVSMHVCHSFLSIFISLSVMSIYLYLSIFYIHISLYLYCLSFISLSGFLFISPTVLLKVARRLPLPKGSKSFCPGLSLSLSRCISQSHLNLLIIRFFRLF